jgi:hypothetical protein
VTYPVAVTNIGVPARGVTAEGLAVSLTIPADNSVVSATGAGYQGIGTDEKTKTAVATWKIDRSGPKEQERLSITIAKPVTAASSLKGDIRWTKPSPKNRPSTDVVIIAPPPL